MRRSFKILSAASLLAALALLLNPAPTFAAEAHALRNQRPADLATAYDAIYSAAYKTGFTTKDPIVRARRAMRLAVDAIASSVAGDAPAAQGGQTPADEAALKAAAAALTAGPPGFQNARVLFAYRHAYFAALDVLGQAAVASPDQAAGIAAQATARAVHEKIAADEAAPSNAAAERSTAGSDDALTARKQHPAAYDAAYKAVERLLGADSKAGEYQLSMAAYIAANAQLIRDHAEWTLSVVDELAITAMFDAAHDRAAKQPHLPR